MTSDSAHTELVCPETRQPLTHADRELVDQLNLLIEQRKLTNRIGAAVTGHVADALVRDDGTYAYAIFDGIARMLIDEAIPLAQLSE